MTEEMTRRERDDLARLVRQRAKLEKAGADQRKAELLAEFEEQISAVYSFDDDETWRKAMKAARAEVSAAQDKIAERCRELGIPKEFAPSLDIQWYRRGQNAVASRRSELRLAAKARLDAMEKTAMTEIERASVEAQTQLILGGLTTEAAKSFLESIPSIMSLMPTLDAPALIAEGTST